MEEQRTETQELAAAAEPSAEMKERKELLAAYQLVMTSLENSTIAGRIALKYAQALEIVGAFRDNLEHELRGR